MNHSDSIQNIMGALMQAQTESGVLPFDGVNSFTNSRYTTLGKVIEITQPVFRKHGLVFTSLPTGDGINIGVTYLLAHPESGEWIRETILSVVEKEPKKSLGQVAGSNVSYFRRYGISALLNLYSDEDVDGNITGKGSSGGKQQKPNATATDGVRPWDANLTKEYLVARAKYHASHANKYNDQKGTRKGAMIAMLNNLFGGDQQRHAALEWLTTKASTKEWEDSAWLAFKDWIEVREVDGEWLPGEHVKQEANNIIKAAMMDQGQQEMEI
jgi:hypothetical protein